MRKLMAISALGTLLGYAAVHFAFFANPKCGPTPADPVTTAPAGPVVLAHVVEVTDTDVLLDPLPGQPVGLPFDAEPSASAAPGAAAPIPHAAD